MLLQRRPQLIENGTVAVEGHRGQHVMNQMQVLVEVEDIGAGEQRDAVLR
jgi:hypothetical protein